MTWTLKRSVDFFHRKYYRAWGHCPDHDKYEMAILCPSLIEHIQNNPPPLQGSKGLFMHVNVWKSQEGGYFVEIPEAPGCLSQGETPLEALEMIHDAYSLWSETKERLDRDARQAT